MAARSVWDAWALPATRGNPLPRGHLSQHFPWLTLDCVSARRLVLGKYRLRMGILLPFTAGYIASHIIKAKAEEKKG